LIASYVGYQPDTMVFDLRENTIVDFSLEVTEMNEIVVGSKRHIIDARPLGTHELDIAQLKSIPTIGGEQDIIKAIQLLPGVQSGTEGSAGLYVRGGGPDQNLILLDGTPVYNISHLFGFVSNFNPDIIRNVKLIKGGFPARYGGRLSSVLDVKMKEGNLREFHGAGTVGLISSRILLEGPLVKDKSAFVFSARRSLADLFMRPISAIVSRENTSDSYEKSQTWYYLYDINTKLNYKLSDKNHVYLSFYHGKDKYSSTSSSEFREEVTFLDEDDTSLQWQNTVGSLRWNHTLGDRLFLNTTLFHTRYHIGLGLLSRQQITANDEELLDATQAYNYGSQITDTGIKADLDYAPTPNHYIKWGIQGLRRNVLPGVSTYQSAFDADTTTSRTLIESLEWRTYVEDEWRIGNRFKAHAGLHYSLFSVNDRRYSYLEPRLTLSAQVHPNTAVHLSYSRMGQYLHLLSNSSLGLPTDLWVSPTENVSPQQSWQVSSGIAHEFGNGINFSLEAYYKSMQGLITYKEGASFLLESASWENQIETDGIGLAYGAEVFLEKTTGKTTGWIGYTLSWNQRQFEAINSGEFYPFRYDRRHDISLVLTHRFNDRIDITGTWVYGTGNAITLPEAVYPSTYYPPSPVVFSGVGANGLVSLPVDWGIHRYEDIFSFSGRNQQRMPAYHRMDIGLNFHKKKKRYERTWSLNIYNLYSRRNPFFVKFALNGDNIIAGSLKGEFTQLSLFPIIPSASYNFKF